MLNVQPAARFGQLGLCISRFAALCSNASRSERLRGPNTATMEDCSVAWTNTPRVNRAVEFDIWAVGSKASPDGSSVTINRKFLAVSGEVSCACLCWMGMQCRVRQYRDRCRCHGLSINDGCLTMLCRRNIKEQQSSKDCQTSSGLCTCKVR